MSCAINARFGGKFQSLGSAPPLPRQQQACDKAQNSSHQGEFDDQSDHLEDDEQDGRQQQSGDDFYSSHLGLPKGKPEPQAAVVSITLGFGISELSSLIFSPKPLEKS